MTLDLKSFQGITCIKLRYVNKLDIISNNLIKLRVEGLLNNPVPVIISVNHFDTSKYTRYSTATILLLAI